ncbi:MAG: hypothetical protein RBS89_08000 [Candidatus Delongbacteria bacterium]|jgi:hypothetical protein|nr:hypothetical protein [Candidatus Delongbacteria bacterium]
MRKFLLLVLFVLEISFSQYIQGDFVRDVSFTDSNVDSNMTILYSEQSIKELVSSGKVIVISFFGPG